MPEALQLPDDDDIDGPIQSGPNNYLRRFGDIPTTRYNIFHSVKHAVAGMPPLTGQKHALTLQDVDYTTPDHFSLAEQKKAILSNKTLTRRLSGTWVLKDKATDQVLDQRRMTIAHVPYLTDRGTFINNGNEYTLSNQLRLRPGIFSRRKANGELEAHINVMPGQGVSHHYYLDPASGVFRLRLGQARIPLWPLLKTMGVTPTQLREAWGPELTAANIKQDSPHHLDKLFEKLAKPGSSKEHKAQAILEAMQQMRLDPQVTQRTLGRPISQVDPEAILATTKKLLSIYHNEADPDDRDHLANQILVGPEDMFSERIRRAHSVLRPYFWRATSRGSVQPMPPGALTKLLQATLLESGLGTALEEVNPAETLDYQHRVTRMGEGGIGSEDAIPDESRAVQPSHLNFVDLSHTPESGRVGVESRIGYQVRKGSDNNLYSRFRDLKTGKLVWMTPQQASEQPIAFPRELERPGKWAYALVGGRIKPMLKTEVMVETPGMLGSFGPLSNMVPMKAASAAQRTSMGARMLAQALPLRGAEAPYVQNRMPGKHDISFEEHYGRHMGAVLSNVEGQVESVTPDEIVVRGPKGKQTFELYNNAPHNRKSVTGDTKITILRIDGSLWRGCIAAYVFAPSDCVWSIDPATRQPAWQRVTGYLKHINDKKLYRVVLSSGREVVVTEDHSLVTLGACGQLRPVYPKDCVVGLTRLPVATLPIMPEGFAVATDWTTKLGSEAALGELVGLYLSEGHCTPGQPGLISIAVSPVDRQHEVLQLTAAFNSYPNGGNVCFTDREFSAWLVTNFGHLSHNKQLASWVFQASEAFRKGVVRGYMGGDGCLHVGSHGEVQLGAGSVSEQLRDDLIELLLSLQIFCTRRTSSSKKDKHRDCYHFRVANSHISKLDCWFFYSDRQRLLSHFYAPQYRTAACDCLPVSTADHRGQFYSQLRNAGITPTSLHRKVNTSHFVSRKTARACLGFYSEWARSPVMWDKVKSILPVAHEEFVYDLAVENSEIFAVAQGLLVHNTYIHNTPQVKPGDTIKPGQLLATSNFTNSKGATALGMNARVGFMSFGGANYEDAVVVSQSFAKRAASEHAYQHQLDLNEDTQLGRGKYQSIFPGKLTKQQLANYDEQGIIKPGTKVQHGEPLILAVRQRPTMGPKIGRRQNAFGDASVLWSHHAEGEVTDIAETKDGPLVVVKSTQPLQVADKLAGRHGNKGVIAQIVPDDEMPTDGKGQPFEVLMNPLGVISRGNPAQVYEAWLGKVAAMTGKPYKVPDFDSREAYYDYADRELRKHGLSGDEDVIDPKTGHRTPGVLTGNMWLMKLHHTAESKGQGRSFEGYTAEGTPAKGGEHGSKRVGVLELQALLSHGAYGAVRDASLVRGQRNEDYWQQFISGNTPSEPQVPFVYQKFVNQLKGAGVNVVRQGNKTHIMALTGRDIDQLAGGREITSPETVDWKTLRPLKGGLFDESLTGGLGGNRWAYIKLHEPMPNPVMEEPIRRVLGLTEEKFLDVLAGKEQLNGHSGPQAIQAALAKIDVPRAIATARAQLAMGKKSQRDMAIRKLKYLESAQRMNMHPRDWMLDKVPVLPPAFRPVSVMGSTGQPLVSDANFLYREVFEGNQNLKALSGQVDDLSDERLAVYKAFKAVTGLGDPVQAQNQERKVKGLLKEVFGSSPKFGCFDDTTEILTQQGWSRFTDLDPNDLVATLNPTTNAFEWQAIQEIHRYAYAGDMFHFKTKRGLDALVTPSHRNWVRKRNAADEENLDAGWIFEEAYMTASTGNRQWFRTAANEWQGHRRRPEFLPETCTLEDFAEFVGWWAAEGWLSDRKLDRVQLCQAVKHTAYCEELDRLTEALALPVSVGNYVKKTSKSQCLARQWTVGSPELASWLREHVGCGAENKRLSREVLDWDASLLLAFFRGYSRGDGSKRHTPRVNEGGTTHRRKSSHTKEVSSANSVSAVLLDGLQEIGCKLGFTVRVRPDRPASPEENRQAMYRANISGSRFVVFEGNIAEVVRYEGEVHCVSVPNGIVYVRRNGKPFFSGNSVQRKLLGSTVDLVGRAVISPNPDLDMDQVGLPEERAWTVYRPFVVRRLVRRGMQRLQALEMFENRDQRAREALLEEMKERPVIINRAPVLHRYGVMAFWPQLTKNHSMEISPIVTKGFGADFDGDAMQYHVPATDDAKRDAIEKMMPSKNLYAVSDFKPHYLPQMEYLGGLWEATARTGKQRPRVFATKRDAMTAYQRGEINPDHPIEIVQH